MFRINVTEQFPGHNSTMRLLFYRSISQSNLVEWETKRMTGMSVDWYLEDANGDPVEVEEMNNYIYDNEMFIKTVNMLYYSEEIMQISEDDNWRIIKNDRVEFINSGQSYSNMAGCEGFMRYKDISYLLESVANETNVSLSLNSTPIYGPNISSSLLETASQMYLYLASCQKSSFLMTMIIFKSFSRFFSQESKNNFTKHSKHSTIYCW